MTSSRLQRLPRGVKTFIAGLLIMALGATVIAAHAIRHRLNT